MIGEIGVLVWPLLDGEKKSLRAAAIAQKESGAPINIRPRNSHKSPLEIINFLDDAGVDISRIVMSHIDCTVALHDTRVELARSGYYLEYDMFSFEDYYARRYVESEENPVNVDVTNDAGRIREIMVLIEEGFLDQMLISNDICYKHRTCCYGGPGYAYILENVVH